MCWLETVGTAMSGESVDIISCGTLEVQSSMYVQSIIEFTVHTLWICVLAARQLGYP